MESILKDAFGTFNRYSGWIVWNLFLAFIPLALSFWLFRRRTTTRTFLWWLALVVFIAFLPNAPYLLTDIIHLIRATRAGYSAWIIGLVFIPLHLFAILAGMQAYVISLLNQGHYLKRCGASRFVIPAELVVHALCALGVYIGRFRRFNSWDLVTQPDSVIVTVLDDLTNRRPLAVIFITFIIITVVYFVMKEITLGLGLRIQSVRRNHQLES
jgi:uncharacterized membrane protein